MDFQVYCDVEPKRQALAQANFELAAATEKLEAIRKKLEVSAKRITEEEMVPHPQTGSRLNPRKHKGT